MATAYSLVLAGTPRTAWLIWMSGRKPCSGAGACRDLWWSAGVLTYNVHAAARTAVKAALPMA